MHKIQILRRQVEGIRRATAYGTASFEHMAAKHNAKIQRAPYRHLIPFSDTLAYYDGHLVITEQNLQFVPAKVRFFTPIR